MRCMTTGADMAKKARRAKGQRATFASPAKGWVVRSAEGRRMEGLRSIASPERRQQAIASLIRTAR